MPTAVAKPVRSRVYDVTLQADVLRTIGFAVACPCGWVGDVRKVWSEAQADARDHNAEHRANSVGSAT